MKKENSVIKLIVVILSLLLVLLLILVLVCNLLKKDEKGQVGGLQGIGKGDQTQILEVDVTGTLGEIKDGLNINKGTIEGVSVIEYFDTTTGTEDKPVVILLHGLFGQKEMYEFMSTVLAQEGYLVITPDARLHGERKEETSMWISQIAIESSKDLDLVMDYYADLELADMDRVCMVGFSLGGLMTYQYLINGEHPVKAAVVAYSTPDWKNLEEESALYCTYNGEYVAPVYGEERARLQEYVTDHSPYDEVVKLKDISLGLVNGGKDDVFSYTGSERLYEELLAAGADVSYCFREDVGHEFTDDDVWLTLFFIEEKLK